MRLLPVSLPRNIKVKASIIMDAVGDGFGPPASGSEGRREVGADDVTGGICIGICGNILDRDVLGDIAWIRSRSHWMDKSRGDRVADSSIFSSINPFFGGSSSDLMRSSSSAVIGVNC